jgi:hypothetical protein
LVSNQTSDAPGGTRHSPPSAARSGWNVADASNRRSIKNPTGTPMTARTRIESTKYLSANALSPRLSAL